MIKSTVWIKENGQERYIGWEISSEDIKDLIRKQVSETECGEDAIVEVVIDSLTIDI